MTERTIRTGVRIRYKRKDSEHTAIVETITRCPRRGDKFGKTVQELAWRDRETAFLLLDQGFCYGYELL